MGGRERGREGGGKGVVTCHRSLCVFLAGAGISSIFLWGNQPGTNQGRIG